MENILLVSFVFLFAAVITVPISNRLGLGSVLGYLLAGIIIGPLLGLVGDETQDIQHYAEFGVVMMLFLVGLELEPEKLWALRHKLLGLGGLQVCITTAIIFVVGIAFNLQWSIALAIGLVLTLSSTAIVLQTLDEKGLMDTHGGQASFSVLLFQDIAVIPMLAFIPLLALPELTSQQSAETHSFNLIANFPSWLQALTTIGTILSIILVGHFLSQPIFRFIALSRSREMFTAFALLLVIGISVLMSLIGLSAALGTFIAGVILATSEYKHELESNLEPFKGLLLGLFFITVGAGVNFDLLQSEFLPIISITCALIVIKLIVLYILGKVFKLKGSDRWLFTFSLAQAGEFGFVLLALTVQSAVIPQELADKLLLVVALSMLMTPLLFIILDKFILPKFETTEERETDDIEIKEKIILAGNGRFGQMINRLLVHSGFKPTVIDLDVDAVEGFSRFGFKTYFGDASRPELLAAAGIDKAELLIIAIDDPERAIHIVKHVRKIRPNMPIIARAYDRNHCYDLYQAGANDIIRETFDSGVRAGKAALISLGINESKASHVSQMFYDRDRHGVKALADLYDPALPRFKNEPLIIRAKELNVETTRLISDILKDE
jgi:CPA2 family monovalent cation:H+ antiporter-2